MDIRFERGFTLIELLIVVVVIGILVAIVVPQYGILKEKSFDAESKSDLRNMITAENAYFADFQAYTDATVPVGVGIDLNGDGAVDLRPSVGVSLQVTAYTDGIQVTSSHQNTANTWCMNSSASNSATPGAVLKATSC